MDDDLDAAIALVYAQPPSAFIAARGALVKELKAAKRRDEAARVAALRRPTKLAWAVGEAVRQAPDAAGSFFSAVEALGASGGDLRQRTADLRQAVAAIVKKADGVDSGEATAALHAIAADPEATEALRLGRLADVPAGGGFGGLALGFGGPAVDEAPPKPEPRTKPVEPAEDGAAADEDRAARAEAVARREEEARLRAGRIAALEAEHGAAADAAAAAEGTVEAARAALDAAQADLDRATADLEEKRRALAATTERLQEARGEPHEP